MCAAVLDQKLLLHWTIFSGDTSLITLGTHDPTGSYLLRSRHRYIGVLDALIQGDRLNL